MRFTQRRGEGWLTRPNVKGDPPLFDRHRSHAEKKEKKPGDETLVKSFIPPPPGSTLTTRSDKGDKSKLSSRIMSFSAWQSQATRGVITHVGCNSRGVLLFHLSLQGQNISHGKQALHRPRHPVVGLWVQEGQGCSVAVNDDTE